jgi:head-tail adaptor
MATVKPGDLNEQIQIIKSVETRPAGRSGQPVRTWDVIETVWAQVLRAPSPGLLVALQMTAIPPAVVTIRYYPDMDETPAGTKGLYGVILDDDTRMAVDGIPVNIDGQKRFLTFAVRRMTHSELSA